LLRGHENELHIRLGIIVRPNVQDGAQRHFVWTISKPHLIIGSGNLNALNLSVHDVYSLHSNGDQGELLHRMSRYLKSVFSCKQKCSFPLWQRLAFLSQDA